jgi:alkylphosphonate utilization operon protein PhnA
VVGQRRSRSRVDDAVKKDSVGNVLQDGDTITVIKDLKVKGTSLVVKVGTKVKNIRLCDGDHDIDCKIDGIGPMKLKSEFVESLIRFPIPRQRGMGSPSRPPRNSQTPAVLTYAISTRKNNPPIGTCYLIIRIILIETFQGDDP